MYVVFFNPCISQSTAFCQREEKREDSVRMYVTMYIHMYVQVRVCMYEDFFTLMYSTK